jgi:hypothetical protein
LQQLDLPPPDGFDTCAGGGAVLNSGKACVRFVLFVALIAVQFRLLKSVVLRGFFRDVVILAAVQLVAKLVLPTVTTYKVVLFVV